MPTGNPPWNFGTIKRIPKVTGPWHVDVKKAGRYRISLRQFPKEAEKLLVGVRAKLAIAGIEKEASIMKDAKGVDFELELPAGRTKLETWIYDKQGKAGGAYFVDVEAL